MEAKDAHCPKLKMNGKKSSKFQFRLPVLLEALDAEKKLEKMVTWTLEFIPYLISLCSNSIL